MSNVVNSWFKVYVNELITFLELTSTQFAQNNFLLKGFTIPHSEIRIPRIVFFEQEKWNSLNAGLTAKQFLRTFPDINSKILELSSLVDQFFGYMKELEILIKTSQEFEARIRGLYNEQMLRMGYPHLVSESNNLSFEDILRRHAGELRIDFISKLDNYPAEYKSLLVQMIIYSLLNLQSEVFLEAQGFFNFCKEQLSESFIESKPTIEEKLQQIINVKNQIAQKYHFLAREIDDLRYALALKHNTSYE